MAERENSRIPRRTPPTDSSNLFNIFIVPLAAVIYGGMVGVYGYGRILPICMVAYSKSDSNIDYEYLYLPLFIASIIGTGVAVFQSI